MKTRIYNAKVLPLAADNEYFEGEVWIDGDKITYVGAPDEKMPTDFDKEIDARGNLVMPGLKNAHTHSAMTFVRSYADGLPLQEWLFNKIFPMEDKLTPEYVYEFTKLAFLEYIASGTTSVFDMYFHPSASAQAAKEYGFRFVVCGAGTSALLENYDKLNNFDPLVSYRLGFHAEYTTSLEELKYASEVIHKFRAPAFAHNSETRKEVDECIGRHGKTPTELFNELGIFDFGGGGFHTVYLSENDKEIFREKQLYAVANPCSNLKLASGISEMADLNARGIPIALGTDGASSNNALSMWREIYLLSTLQKVLTKDAQAMPAETALRAATSGSAHAMGLDDCDCLAAGKKADIIMIDLNKPNMQPINNMVNNLVYSGSDSNVCMTMIAGKVVYKDGEFFVGEEPQKVYEKVSKILKSMKD